MAACDADLRFTFFDVGSPGSDGDMNVFSRTDFGKNILMDTDSSNFPTDSMLNDRPTPFFFIGDDAFPLTQRLMKPFGKRSLDSNKNKIFNYRLSRARRTIENAFGLLVMRWGCLRSEFLCGPDRVKKIVSACCALHNFLLNRNAPAYTGVYNVDRVDANGGIIEGECHEIGQNMDGLFRAERRGRLNQSSLTIRDRLADYFLYTDPLTFQNDRAHCS